MMKLHVPYKNHLEDNQNVAVLWPQNPKTPKPQGACVDKLTCQSIIKYFISLILVYVHSFIH